MNHINTLKPADHQENLFGVCAAIGDVTGINPIVFRLGFVVAILAGAFAPAVGIYCLAGIAVRVAQR